jgi:hypothetical protein
MVLEGSSKATGTMWQRRVVEVGQVKMKVDTTSIRVRIIADGNYTADGKYVAAAMKALRRVTGRHIVFGDGGWLFWLSDRPVMGEGYERVWCYAQGKEVSVDTWMEGVHVTKEIVAPAGEPVWRDGYGRGLLSKAGNVFRFYSRLDANWGGLVWSSRLPVLLGGLMIADEQAGSRDRRVLDVQQIRPAVGLAPEAEGGRRSDGFANVQRRVGVERVDLRPAVWVLVLGLFLLERIKANQYEQA